MKEKLRVGVIGAGAVVREIYQYLYFRSEYSPMLEICAVANPGTKNRNWFGDLAGLPRNRRFADYREMLAKVDLDAVQINTPDNLHLQPTLDALAAGLDVILPKPTAATIKEAHAMIQAAKKAGRFLGVDFHKRDDPRIKEAEARFKNGRYGRFQTGVFYMIDKLLVSDPNHSPRFFSLEDYAEQNTPVSFLTVHMADALMKITGLMPAEVRATGYSHKLPSLKPRAVKGYDLVDTEIVFESGAVAHVITGWALPNTAWAVAVQSGRMICSDGLLDLGIDTPGFREIHADGVIEANPLFRNFEKSGKVTGYGISNPGRLYQEVLARQNGATSENTETPLDFYTTVIVEAAERSLKQGKKIATGATRGEAIDLNKFVRRQIGNGAREYGWK
ncbi:MAG TPA: Gfo/Idh/MocA family oxidoreductase [Verrucomicrobiae bacterium]|jgi:predicted dehydrogenase|nr:Gfo/Idh/MocA family oxidoreductase [Verrucomicrobiae bacterium]